MQTTSREEVGAEWSRTQRLKRDRNIPGLLQQLDSPLETSRGSTVHEAAVKALSEIRETTAVPRLRQLIDAPNKRVRLEL